VIRRLAVLLTTATLASGLAVAAHAGTTAGDANAASFVSKTNAERTSRGLRAYAVASDLAAVARRHSEEMAAKQSLYHNPNLGSDVSGWQAVGENVGDGGTVDSIHTAFMNSPEHRKNILDTDFTQIGIGTVTDANGVIWVTEVFRKPSSAPTVAAPVTTRASRSAPVVRRAPAKPAPAKPAVKAVRKAVSTLVRPDTDAYVTALAGGTAPGDPFVMARLYVTTMTAIAR